MTDLKIKNLDNNLENLEKFKNLDFYESQIEPNVNMSEIFGSFEKKEESVIVVDKKAPDYFKYICQVGLFQFEELLTGEIVSTSYLKPSNYIIYDPESHQIREIEAINKIEFLFKREKNDEIITIDVKFNVKLWFNGKCLNSYNLLEAKILTGDFIGDRLFILTEDFSFTILNYFDGQIINQFYLDLKLNKFIRALIFENFIICATNTKKNFNLIKFDLISGIKDKEELISKPSSLILEKLSKKKIITNSSYNYLLIWNSRLEVIFEKMIYSCDFLSIVPCHNELVVSNGFNGKIKVWNSKNLDLVKQLMLKNLL